MVIVDILSGLGNILLNWNDLLSFATNRGIPMKFVWKRKL